MQSVFVVLLLCALAAAQQEDGPSISIDGDNLKFVSDGDLVFEAGEGGAVSFMAAGQPIVPAGLKGDKGDNGDTGPQGPEGARGPAGQDGTAGPPGRAGFPGPPGPPGSSGPTGPQGSPGLFGRDGADGRDGANGTDGVDGRDGQDGQDGRDGKDSQDGEGGGIVSWNQCAWEDLNIGRDYGLLVECRVNKKQNDTWLKLTWNGNMRITRCETCCMRWYFTIDGQECSDPGPIDAVLFQTRNYHILRTSQVTGICREAGGSVLGAGAKRVQFQLMECPGFGGFVYDAYTGWNSLSKIIIEEVPPRDNTFPEVRPEPPPEFIYRPHYCQYFYQTLSTQSERNLGVVAQVNFNKEHDHTVLRITWEGNFRKKSCTNCCSRWWITVDGAPCNNYEDITTSISSTTAYDIFAPTTLSGICFESGDLPIADGNHTIKLEVGNCPGFRISNTASGFFSTSRLIVDELPRPRDPEVNPAAYHPQWAHCAIPETSDASTDSGPITSLNCTINKTMEDSSLRLTFNGIIRITGCADCCMRWFLTIDGAECLQPAPVEAVLYSINASTVNIHRGSTIVGICEETVNGSIGVGEHEVMINVGQCEGFNQTFDAHTGLNSVSTFTLEEMPAAQNPVTESSFYPNWLQCVTDTALNSTTTNSSIMNCTFTKKNMDTVLKVSWDGNIALRGCMDCCMRWYITVNGEECSDPGAIDAAIRQDLTDGPPVDQFDLHRPASVVGICRGTSSASLAPAGEYTIGLVAGECPGFLASYSVLTGYNSVSRFIVEELPEPDPLCGQ